MSLEQTLLERCSNKCELCSADAQLNIYQIPPQQESIAEKSIMLCETCLTQVNDPEKMDVNHWRCLSESMWSEHPGVQVMAWRMLNHLNSEGWAQDLLGQLYLEEETQNWAQALESESNSDVKPTKDSNGNTLQTGDSVTLIKDLDVKGAGFTAKRGTIVRKISLTDNPEHIEGRVNGTQIVLLTCFLKKV